MQLIFSHFAHSSTFVLPQKRIYTTQSECSIMFEVDGPYLAMVLPSARVEGQNVKG